MSESTPESRACPKCGAAVPADAGRCPACDSDVIASQPINPYAPPRAAEPAHPTFTLATTLWTIGVIALGLGLFRAQPGLGIAFVIVTAPALIRTAVMASRRRASGQPSTTGERINDFVISWGLALIVTIASGIAFVATCFPSGMFFISVIDMSGLIPAILIGVAAAGVVAWKLGGVLFAIRPDPAGEIRVLPDEKKP